jgi:hypothetical protein
MATWTCSCERYFPETQELTKKGVKKRMMVDVRKMKIEGDFIGTTSYEVNYLKRNGEFKFYVKQLVPPKKEKWPTLKLKAVILLDKWIREVAYTREQFKQWLDKRIGTGAESAIVDLMTMPPQNLAA